MSLLISGFLLFGNIDPASDLVKKESPQKFKVESQELADENEDFSEFQVEEIVFDDAIFDGFEFEDESE